MLGNARRNWLEANAAPHDDEPDYQPGLAPVQQLLADPKRATDLVKLAATALASIKLAKASTDELEASQRKAEDGIAAAKAEIEKLRAQHEAAMKKREELVSATERQVANSLAQAKLDAKAAADLKAEAKRRLDRVEAAVNG